MVLAHKEYLGIQMGRPNKSFIKRAAFCSQTVKLKWTNKIEGLLVESKKVFARKDVCFHLLGNRLCEEYVRNTVSQ